MSVKIDLVNKLLAKWRDEGRTLGHLLMFVSLNMQALRKIVKKQHKLVRSFPSVCLPCLTKEGT
jgi:predicted  nucleic acid-binding Zn ribbon protein